MLMGWSSSPLTARATHSTGGDKSVSTQTHSFGRYFHIQRTDTHGTGQTRELPKTSPRPPSLSLNKFCKKIYRNQKRTSISLEILVPENCSVHLIGNCLIRFNQCNYDNMPIYNCTFSVLRFILRFLTIAD